MDDLTGQVALVTGAAGGIGRAVAAALARREMVVCLLGRNEAALAAVAAEIGAGARVVPCDLTDDARVAALPERLGREAGGVDVVVHCAAVYFQEPLETAPVEHFDLQYRVNLRAPYVLTQALLPQVKRRPGQIVFINSTTGIAARPGVTQYAAVKHGLKGMADALRAELAPAGVRVVSVYPGQTATPMQERRYAIEGRAYDPARLIQPADVAEVVATAVSLPRTAEVTDVQVRPRAG
jgi:NAD(P)-dependent dehydrogenase (short-subunit alcohol dehydrogenase family)